MKRYEKIIKLMQSESEEELRERVKCLTETEKELFLIAALKTLQNYSCNQAKFGL